MKSLNTIQTVYKVARIVSLVLMILSIVGAVACGVGAVIVSIMFSVDKASTILTDFLSKIDFDSFRNAICELLGDGICSAISALLMYRVKEYCEFALSKGSPFNEEIASKTFELGKLTVILWIVIVVVSAIFSLVGKQNINDYGAPSLVLGLFLMFLSVVYKYGAELQINKTNKNINDSNPNDFGGNSYGSNNTQSDSNDSNNKNDDGNNQSNKIFL